MASSDDSDNDVPVETLVAGRAKRATAGNRLNHLLEKEVDDDLELLFAEDEEDIEFEGEDGEVASDVELDSSSDDEDQDSTFGQDDLEGEKELKKQDRVERRKKRKAEMVFKRPSASHLKAKLNFTAHQAGSLTPAPSLKRKSERVSWLPTFGESSLRSSSRKQTVQNKQLVHARMQENETKRRQQIEVMETAAKRKEASRPKALTQADRLAEADQTERRNARSLNRWEVTEKKRLEKQKADLAELKERQLKKPFVSWWSGPSKWIDGRLVAVGAKAIVANNTDLMQISLDGKAKSVLPKSRSEGQKANDVDAVIADTPESGIVTNLVELPLVDRSSPSRRSNVREATGSVPWVLESNSVATPAQDHRQIPTPVTLPTRPCDPNIPVPSTVEISARNMVIMEGVDGNLPKFHSLQNTILARKKGTLKTTSEAQKCSQW